MLLALIPLIPLLILPSLLVKRPRLDYLPTVLYLLSFALSIYLLGQTLNGPPLVLQLAWSGPFTPALACDSLTAVFLVLTTLLWLLVSLYGPSYMRQEGKAKTYQAMTSLTLAAVLGVFLADDFFTLLLFFEIMTVASYFWVVHRWDKKSIKAGYFYLFFSIMAGLLLALGMVLLAEAAGQMPSFSQGVSELQKPGLYPWSLGLLAGGFAIKAGMVPFQLWLPHAHSAAPTPASALLSGLLIKVGAYGLIRVGAMAGWGRSLAADLTWLGPALISLGLITMLVGVASALLQADAKRLLAYHSVSQMGYIILGLGCGLYLAEAGGLAFLGALYHIINHALFKAALFLGVGLVYLATKETDLGKLGGLLKKFPWTATFMLIAALGIAGLPGLNGYASKTLLHHGLLQAVAKGPGWLGWVEKLFNLVGIGTAASFAKLYYLIFLKKTAKSQLPREKFALGSLAPALLSLLIVAIGSNPHFTAQIILEPAAKALGLAAAADLAAVNFWQPADLLSMALSLGLGLAFCWAGLRWGWFAWSPPRWLTIEGLVSLTIVTAARTGNRLVKRTKSARDRLTAWSGQLPRRLTRAVRQFDQVRQALVGRTSLVGISADAAIVIFILILLLACYMLADFGLG